MTNERCPFDSDGNGNCHLCAHQPSGCPWYYWKDVEGVDASGPVGNTAATTDFGLSDLLKMQKLLVSEAAPPGQCYVMNPADLYGTPFPEVVRRPADEAREMSAAIRYSMFAAGYGPLIINPRSPILYTAVDASPAVDRRSSKVPAASDVSLWALLAICATVAALVAAAIV